MEYLREEVGLWLGEMEHHAQAFQMPATTYCTSHCYAYRMYNSFTDSVITVINNISRISTAAEGPNF